MKIEKIIKNSRFVVDASVAVKWFCFEEESPKAKLLLNRTVNGDIILYAPELLFYEVGNSLWKSKRKDNESLTQAMETIDSLGIRLEPLSMPLMQLTIDFMTKYDVTFYDAAYVALAYSMHIPLISCDAKGHKKIKEVEVVEL